MSESESLYSQLTFDVGLENAVIARMLDQQQTAQEAAREELKRRPQLLDSWLDGVTTRAANRRNPRLSVISGYESSYQSLPADGETVRSGVQYRLHLLLLSGKAAALSAPAGPLENGRRDARKLRAENIASQPAPTVDFHWQGGEPTLLGIDFSARRCDYRSATAAGSASAMFFRPTELTLMMTGPGS